MSSPKNELHDRIKARTGTAVLTAASVFAVLIFSDRMDMKFVSFPPLWYTSRQLHFFLCGLMFVVAAVLLKSPPLKRQNQPRPLFRTCRLLTRDGCHLCDDALAILLRFQDSLPQIEVIDIDDDPQLIRQFGESVPVVEIDGQVRFRGAVNPLLFQRLVDAAELRNQLPGPAAELPQVNGLTTRSRPD